MIFRTLSRDEYDRLSPDEKLQYLMRLMEDIGEKTMEIRRSIEARDQANKPRPG